MLLYLIRALLTILGRGGGWIGGIWNLKFNGWIGCGFGVLRCGEKEGKEEEEEEGNIKFPFLVLVVLGADNQINYLSLLTCFWSLLQSTFCTC